MSLSERTPEQTQLVEQRATGEPCSIPLDSAAALPSPNPLSPANFSLASGIYRVRFAETKEDLQAAFRLRFLVFNLELREGLESSYTDGYDTDAFDAVCDHLIVEQAATNQVVGTYRLQTGPSALKNFGYYSAREFDLTPYEPIRDSLVEAGRASIHRDHRSFEVLTLLWRGIAHYALSRKARYLMGCSSLTSQDPLEGSAMYRCLEEHLAPPAMQTVPFKEFSFPVSEKLRANPDIRPPRLLRAYLSIGARICGPPAIDREFKTIDFLTLLDLDEMPRVVRSRFLE
jgi:putative hemolysin